MTLTKQSIIKCVLLVDFVSVTKLISNLFLFSCRYFCFLVSLQNNLGLETSFENNVSVRWVCKG